MPLNVSHNRLLREIASPTGKKYYVVITELCHMEPVGVPIICECCDNRATAEEVAADRTITWLGYDSKSISFGDENHPSPYRTSIVPSDFDSPKGTKPFTGKVLSCPLPINEKVQADYAEALAAREPGPKHDAYLAKHNVRKDSVCAPGPPKGPIVGGCCTHHQGRPM